LRIDMLETFTKSVEPFVKIYGEAIIFSLI